MCLSGFFCDERTSLPRVPVQALTRSAGSGGGKGAVTNDGGKADGGGQGDGGMGGPRLGAGISGHGSGSVQGVPMIRAARRDARGD